MATITSSHPDVPAAGTSRAAVPVFAGALVLSAFLLFAVQPMFARMALPVLGGSPAVWSVATVVFQSLLLVGYAYAHGLAKLPPRVGILVHLSVLALAASTLPIAGPRSVPSASGGGEAFWLAGLFLSAIGLPFAALAASGPLLQAWFVRTGHRRADNPYFLYGASNVGSFAALAAYPVLIEPILPLGTQSMAWSLGYAALVGLIGVCGILAGSGPAAPMPQATTTARSSAPTAAQRLGWTAVAAIPSGLLVAVTAHISTDIAAIPLLWVIPLALYLLTFIVAFRDGGGTPNRLLLLAQAGGTGIVLALIGVGSSLTLGLLAHLGLFVVTAFLCHQQLYGRRPGPERLTEFYLCLSAGGALGGILCGLAAPLLFSSVLEYPVLLAAALLVRLPTPGRRGTATREAVLVAAVCCGAVGLAYAAVQAGLPAGLGQHVLLALFVVLLALSWRSPVRASVFAFAAMFAAVLFQPGGVARDSVRSFFGVHRIYETQDGRFRLLAHGTTVHGAIRIREDDGAAATGRPEPTTYYGTDAAIGQAIASVREARGGVLGGVSAIGLGAGSLACHARERERWSFYEIDPEVARIARDPARFRFLSACGPDIPVVLGDARLTLAEAPTGQDLIVLDAFSSDSIPVHLVTREAIGLYLAKLGPRGALVLHISNRHLDLTAVLARVGAEHGLVTLVRREAASEPFETRLRAPALVVAMARRPEDLGEIARNPAWQRIEPDPSRRPWTDDYANVLEAMLDRIKR